MRCILEQHHVLGPDQRAFPGNAVGDMATVTGLFVVDLGHVGRALPADHHADVAVGEVGVDSGGVEIANVGANLQQQFLGFLVILGILAVVRQAQVVEGDGNQLGGGVQRGHAALAEAGDILLLEDQVPGVDRRVGAEQLADLVHVVGDPGGSPEIRYGIAIAGIVGLKLPEDVRVEVLPVGEPIAVEFLEDACLDQSGQDVGGDHHHVVAGAADHQFALRGLGAVEGVEDDTGAGFLLESLGRFRGDEVIPVVKMDAGLRSPCTVRRCRTDRRQDR